MTDFGDAAVTLPLLLTVGLVLALREGPRRAGWILAIGGAFAAILVLKLVFGVFPSFGAPIDVRSPSGHTATAAAAYGGLALLLSGRRAVGVGAALFVAIVVGMSRVALDAHTVGEVLVGGGVGVGGVLLLAVLMRRALPCRARVRCCCWRWRARWSWSSMGGMRIWSRDCSISSSG